METAIENNNIAKVRELLASGVSPNAKIGDGDTALILASFKGHIETVKTLLEAGANIDIQNKKGDTALILASNNGHAETVKTLLEAGANIDIQNKNGNTALILASNNGHIETVKTLLEAGANIDIQNKNGDTALILASNNGHAEIVKTLLEAGANIDIQSIHGNTTLILASFNGNTGIVKILLEAGANIDIQSIHNNTALIIASNNGHTEIVKILLDAGANIDIQNIHGNTALILASFNGHTETVNTLLDADANIDMQNKNGDTALILASLNGHNEIAKELLEAGANINIQNVDGATPLFIAAGNNHKDIIIRLLRTPTIKNIPVEGTKTVLDIAKEGRFTPEINELIIQRFSPELLWKGWSHSDSEKLDVIFDKKAANYACCPVCLKFIERSEACMYMKHDCSSLGGFYHTELYDKYKNEEGKIGWCTICNRIAIGHRHYKLGLASAPKPILGPGNGDPFEKDCRVSNGGGGIPEKFARFRRMREFAKQLMEEEGELLEKDVLTQLVEETWNAPFSRIPAIQRLLREKKWNIAHTTFPANRVAAAAAAVNGGVPEIREFLRPAPNRNNADLQPIVHPVGMNQIGQDEEAENVVQFRHKKKDGTINTHGDTWISKDSLEGLLEWRITNFGDESAIYCWEYPKCDALLYPEEIRGLVPDELYERYKTMFNQQMAVRTAAHGGARKGLGKTRKAHYRNKRRGQLGGQQKDFFTEATDVECVVVRRPVKGGRPSRRIKRIARKHTQKRRPRKTCAERKLSHKNRVSDEF